MHGGLENSRSSQGNGRGGGRRWKRMDFKEKRNDEWSQDIDKTRYKKDEFGNTVPLTMNNEAFVEYYKAQGIVPAEEWDTFIEWLRKPLPMTFRINGSGHQAAAIRDKLKSDFFSHFSEGPVEIDGEAVEPPRALPWYPAELAWEMKVSRRQLRKADILENVHEFIKLQNETGGITRQEAVSMVPPLFLDVLPHHRVLDMCAAPGSKTIQILEMLHQGNEAIPEGFVIANDVDFQRCNLLTHQTKRIFSPCMVITNHEAQNFPVVSHPVTKERLEFDRILCDVPCSGDGTLRKNPDIWRKWTGTNGNGLHLLQTKIALQACRLLKTGGRLVYSTCSFNPVENEAVVAEVLRRCGGAVRLVDVSAELPELRRDSGMTAWRVFHQKGLVDTYAQAQEAGAVKLIPSMFSQGDCAALGLGRCMRFLPHHADTGGFFVAVLEKVAECQSVSFPEPWQALRKRKREEMWRERAKEGGEAGEEGEGEGERAEAEEEKPAKKSAGGDGVAGEEGDVTMGVVESSGEVKGEGEEEKRGAVEVKGEGEEEKRGEGGAAGGWGDTETDAPLSGARGGGGRGRDGGKHKGIDPILPVTMPDVLESISTFYGLDIQSLRSQLITRSLDNARPKKMYFITPQVTRTACLDACTCFITPQVKHLLELDTKEVLKIPAVGVKVFERQNNKTGCDFRMAQEGLPLLLPFVGRQIFHPTPLELRGMLHYRGLRIGDAADGRLTLSDGRTVKELEDVRGGCCVAVLREEDNKRLGLPIGMEGAHGDVRQAPLAVACWKGQFTVNVLLGKADCAASLDRLMGHIKKHGTKEEAQELQPIIEGTKDDGGEAQDQAGEAAEAKAGDIKAE